ncbi:MAG: aminopeptidase P family protein [Nitrospirae bacterium]|nr:aminopeptidase P family protein [Nitrospirota bacterium]
MPEKSQPEKNQMGKGQALLMIAASEVDADLYYGTGFIAPDPFIFFQIGKEKFLLMSDLEVDRARAQAQVDRVLSYSHYEEKAKSRGNSKPKMIDVLHEVFTELGIRKLIVPGQFWVEKALLLEARGYEIEVKKGSVFEERAFKTEEEIRQITETLRFTEEAVDRAVRMIREADIREGRLYHHGEILTSEAVKKEINLCMMANDCIGKHTIVSSGEDTCDPHHEGSGPLKSGVPIILDVFPQSGRTRYYADITRTVVKGRPSDKIKKMYDVVLHGQEIAFDRIRDGANGREIHEAIVQSFVKAGFETGEVDGRMQGFFHGTGHGLGIEVHEPPRISRMDDTLRTGHVVTVEPGLYYKGVGGVRIEDLVVVRQEGCDNLTRYPKVLEV